METDQLLINFMLYVLLPLWGIAGFVDWCCHRATNIESTSGIKETILHSLMGMQMGIPILFCLLFKVNVLVLFICFAAWAMHEVVAHLDVRFAAPRRHISIWEMHAHSYLATLPMYMLITIIVINWPVALKLLTLNWQGEFQLTRIVNPHGGSTYLPAYLTFMTALCVLPYAEENMRCLIYWFKHRQPT